MKTRLLIMMSMLVAAPVAAQDDDLAAEGEVGAEADVSADVATEEDVVSDDSMGAEDDAYASDPVADESTDSAGSAAATAYSQRSITLPSGTLRIDVGPADRALLQRGGFVITGTPGDTGIDLRAGAAFGIIDGLEAGAMVLPLALSPEADYGNPSIYGRFRILDGSFQLGAQVTAMIPVQDGSDFGLSLGVPIKIMLGDNMHLNTGIEFQIAFADPDAIFGINIPVEFAFNITESIFAGLSTGLWQPNLDVSTTLIPLGLFAGYTLPLGDGMLLDATVDFSFPGFINTTTGADNPGTDIWQLIFGGVMRVDLL